jgi:hypothetical protein
MLRISIIETPTTETIVLEGSLTEPYIPELEKVWEKARSVDPKRGLIVDLRNATYIDRKSEEMLLHMKRDGAHFIACGIATTHQLETLGIPCQEASDKLH